MYPQSDDWTLLEWAGALAGEAGEAANIAKKIRRDDIFREKIDSFADELADVLTYAFVIAGRYGIDLEKHLRDNFKRRAEKHNCPMML